MCRSLQIFAVFLCIFDALRGDPGSNMPEQIHLAYGGIATPRACPSLFPLVFPLSSAHMYCPTPHSPLLLCDSTHSHTEWNVRNVGHLGKFGHLCASWGVCGAQRCIVGHRWRWNALHRRRWRTTQILRTSSAAAGANTRTNLQY